MYLVPDLSFVEASLSYYEAYFGCHILRLPHPSLYRMEQERFQLATDTEFWFSVYFQSREQKEAFLQALSWLANGDKYLNGLELAEAMGIKLPEVNLPKPRPFNRKLLNLVKR